MILHLSISANDPAKTATTLAKLMGGRAVRIGPTKASWSAIGPDPIGDVIEVVERGTQFHRGEQAVDIRKGADDAHCAFHFLMESVMTEQEVMKTAAEANVPAVRSSRGIFGDLIELWIDDRLLVEVLPLEWARTYRRVLGSEEVRMHVGKGVEGRSSLPA